MVDLYKLSCCLSSTYTKTTVQYTLHQLASLVQSDLLYEHTYITLMITSHAMLAVPFVTTTNYYHCQRTIPLADLAECIKVST